MNYIPPTGESRSKLDSLATKLENISITHRFSLEATSNGLLFCIFNFVRSILFWHLETKCILTSTSCYYQLWHPWSLLPIWYYLGGIRYWYAWRVLGTLILPWAIWCFDLLTISELGLANWIRTFLIDLYRNWYMNLISLQSMKRHQQ